ncbi:MAG: nitrate ABC transporter substrate-binding protein [Streptosporangiales bacterium]|nr:nitrate ABC transporter substrate-binding protein [Streptosporangiales bacterium]
MRTAVRRPLPPSRALLAAGALLTLTATLAAGCGGGATSSGGSGGSGESKVVVAETAGMPTAFLQYGIKKGFFEGLTVEVQSGQGGAASIPAVVSGDAQFAGSNAVSVLLAGGKGLPIKIVAPGSFATDDLERDYSSVMVRDDGSIDSLKDLEGKTVAVNTLDNINDLTLMKLLDDAGADSSKVNLIEVPFPEMAAALRTGKVDATNPIEPFVSQSLAEGARIIGSPFSGTRRNLQVGCFVTTEQFLQQNPETVERFRAGLSRTAKDIAEHPDAFREFLPGAADIEPELAEEMVLPAWQTSIDRESLQLLADLMVKYKIAQGRPPVAELLEGTKQ